MYGALTLKKARSEPYSSTISAVRELLSTLIQNEPSCSVYDPIAAAFVLDLSIIKTVPMDITVDFKSGATTVVMPYKKIPICL